MKTKDEIQLIKLLKEFQSNPGAFPAKAQDIILELCADIIAKFGEDYNYYLTSN